MVFLNGKAGKILLFMGEEGKNTVKITYFRKIEGKNHMFIAKLRRCVQSHGKIILSKFLRNKRFLKCTAVCN